MRLLVLAGVVLASFGTGGAPATEPVYRDLGRLISSRDFGYGYAYAPTIIHDGRRFHMLFCSYGRRGVWDYVRYAVSEDGRTWSPPQIVLTATENAGERAACDPSLVRFRAPGDEQPYFYLFYSGNAENVGTTMFVARADTMEGPYAKWTTRRTWEVDPPDPQPIIAPANPKPEKSGFYGAGQQSVVVRDGRLVSWFTDDTSCGASRCDRLFTASTRDPTSWPRATPTDVAGASSVDVKYDPGARRYEMWSVEGAHTPDSWLARRRSTDGVRWSPPDAVCGVGCFDPNAHNLGVSGDASGHSRPGPLLVVYGAPLDRDRRCGVCHGRWDLFGGFVANPHQPGTAPAGAR